MLFYHTLGLVALIYLCGPVQAGGPIHVSLSKETAMQAGRLGQPVTSYFTEIGLGTPRKSFKMVLDINAKETWVPHYSRLGLVLNRLHYTNGYSKKDSSSGQKESLEFTFDYNGCELTGKGYEDDLEFQRVTDPAPASKNAPVRQRFLAISAASNDRLSEMPFDGVLNLNPVFMSPTGTRSILVNLNQARLIDDLKFGLYLDASANNRSEGGELTLGGINPDKFVGDIKYHSLLVQPDAWEVKLNNVMLGGQVVSCIAQPECKAVLSTGVNDLYGPREDILAIMKLLGVEKPQKDQQKDELFEIDCLRVAEVPELSFNIDGLKYVVPPTSYIKKKVDGIFFKSATCYVSILPSAQGSNQWVLGTNFLQNYYSVFDFNRRQVGLAKKRV